MSAECSHRSPSLSRAQRFSIGRLFLSCWPLAPCCWRHYSTLPQYFEASTNPGCARARLFDLVVWCGCLLRLHDPALRAVLCSENDISLYARVPTSNFTRHNIGLPGGPGSMGYRFSGMQLDGLSALPSELSMVEEPLWRTHTFSLSQTGRRCISQR